MALTGRVIDTAAAARHLGGMTTPQNTSTLPAPLFAGLARARASRWAALPVVLAGTFMVVLDFFIVNVALPSMQLELHASGGAIEWVVAGYALDLGRVPDRRPARLGDRFGRRRTFALGLAVFTLSSAACGVAPAVPTVLVLARLVQGLGAALLMPERAVDHRRHLRGPRPGARRSASTDW